MQIVRNEEQIVEVYYRPTDPFSNVIGGFPCDKNGRVDVEALPEEGQVNYRRFVNSVSNTGVIKKHEYRYVKAATVEICPVLGWICKRLQALTDTVVNTLLAINYRI